MHKLLDVVISCASRERFRRRPTKIFVNICANLMIGYIIFVTGVDNISNGGRCTAIAALLQFFFLSTWCWMATYSYDLYLSLVKVGMGKAVGSSKNI